MFAGGLNFLQIGDELFLPHIPGFLDQHFAVTDDSVHGGAQFMAHVGEERALGGVGRFGLFFCLLGRRSGSDCLLLKFSSPNERCG